MEKVEAGILKDALNFLKNLSDKLFKFLNESDKYDLKFDDVKQIDENTTVWKGKYKGKISTTITWEALGNDLFNIRISVKDTKKNEKELKNVKAKDIEQSVNEALESMIDDDLKKAHGIKECRSIRVRLQKITSAREPAVEVSAITANTDDYKYASELLDTVLDNDEFFDAIPEEPTDFEIIEDEDGYDIATIDPMDVTEIMEQASAQTRMSALYFQDILYFNYPNLPPDKQQLADELLALIAEFIDFEYPNVF